MPLNMSGVFSCGRTLNLQGLIIGEEDDSNGANEAFLRSRGFTITRYEDGRLSVSGGNISGEEILNFLNSRSNMRGAQQQHNNENGSINNTPAVIAEVSNYATAEEEAALKVAVDLADTLGDKVAILHDFNNNYGGIKRLSSEAQHTYVDVISSCEDLKLYHSLSVNDAKDRAGQSYVKKLKF